MTTYFGITVEDDIHTLAELAETDLESGVMLEAVRQYGHIEGIYFCEMVDDFDVDEDGNLRVIVSLPVKVRGTKLERLLDGEG